MSTTFANSIDSNPIYADRAENDKDGNRIDQTYAKSASLATVATTGDYDDLIDKPDLSIYAETANLATVATTGDYDDLVNRPTIPAAQINSDWNSNSGVSQILNKPTLSTVATTGDYDDLVNKPSIPAAQVNADWNSSSGVSEILNKPSLAAVATSGDYSDLSNTPSIPTATSDLTNDSGFITLSDVPPEEVEVLTYGTSTIEEYRAALSAGKKIIVCKVRDPDDGWRYVMQSVSSPFPEWMYCIGVTTYRLRLDYNGVTGWTTLVTNNTTSTDSGKVFSVDQYGNQVWAAAQGTTYSAGTGIDITANTISVENPLPSSTSADEGKVLKVDANGDPEWATGGGGTQVQSNWLEDDTTDPSYIENKPTPKTLVAGQGIAISESSASLTVTNTVARDAVNLVAGSGVTLTQSGSDLTISSAGTTYTAGTGIDITNDEISLEAPVDLVAGPGITVDNPDGNTVRVSNIGMPVSETAENRCGTFKGYPVFTKTYVFTGTVGASETTINFTIDEKVGTDNVDRIWIDPSYSFVRYNNSGSNSIFLPINWRLGAGRAGSVCVINAEAGTLTCRCVDTASTPLTFSITVRFTRAGS